MSRNQRKTTEQFRKEVYSLVGEEYKVLDNYINNQTKIEFLHVPYNHTFYMTPHNFLAGYRCPKERVQRIKAHNPNTLSIDDVKSRVNSRLGDSYKILSTHIEKGRKVRIKHLLCGYEWVTSIQHIMNDTSCPKCQGNLQKTTESFKQEVKSIVGDEYEVLGEYIGANRKIEFKHNRCGHCFYITPSNFLRGQRCPKERSARIHNAQAITTEDFIKKLNKKFPNRYKVLGEYYNNATPIKVKHLKCGHVFSILPSKLLNRGSCSYCKTSIGENNVADVLRGKFGLVEDVDYKHGVVLPNRLHLDFYLPKMKVAIEYNGAQHYRPVKWFGGQQSFKKQKERDRVKKEYCESHNIRLIIIPYTIKSVDRIYNFLLKHIKLS